VVLACVACRKTPAPEAAPAVVADAAPSAAAPAPVSAAAAAPKVDPVRDEAKAVTEAWSAALDRHDVAALEPLYGDRVAFYGNVASRSAVLEAKRRALGPKSTFRQTIADVEPASITHDEELRVVVTFTKRSGSPPKLATVDAKLVLAGRPLRIVEESDTPSDEKAKEKSLSRCQTVASEVVQSLPPVKKLLADVAAELPKYPDRFMGGLGVLPNENGKFSTGIGVHHPDRYEALVWYDVDNDGALHVSAMGEDVPVPPAMQARVVAACK
jgi:hypothetical protein